MSTSPSSLTFSSNTSSTLSLQPPIMPALTESDASNPLDARIKDPPKELQDTILNFTDAFHIPATVLIDESFKPPIALQLNRKLRAKFAKDYYVHGIFTGKLTAGTLLYPYFHIWMRRLDKTYLSAIRTAHITV